VRRRWPDSVRRGLTDLVRRGLPDSVRRGLPALPGAQGQPPSQDGGCWERVSRFSWRLASRSESKPRLIRAPGAIRSAGRSHRCPNAWLPTRTACPRTRRSCGSPWQPAGGRRAVGRPRRDGSPQQQFRDLDRSRTTLLLGRGPRSRVMRPVRRRQALLRERPGPPRWGSPIPPVAPQLPEPADIPARTMAAQVDPRPGALAPSTLVVDRLAPAPDPGARVVGPGPLAASLGPLAADLGPRAADPRPRPAVPERRAAELAARRRASRAAVGPSAAAVSNQRGRRQPGPHPVSR